MRLINTETLKLEEYFGDGIPKYAILSHTWREEEVTYQDWQQEGHGSTKMGFQKIQAACRLAQKSLCDYLWVDTNCINKDSSAELSEAINSMFTWYHRAAICFVYLDDFQYKDDKLDDLGSSRWFKRGWTLQELLAPITVQFFDASWHAFGYKHQALRQKISEVTSIPVPYLTVPGWIHRTSVSRRMSWVAGRSTTREEDIAYCLLGLFEVNMPLLYGEGSKAFIRLQEEIIKHNNDHTIFCWSYPPSMRQTRWQGCLAPRPDMFHSSGDYLPTGAVSDDGPSDFQLTNSGLRISLPLLKSVVGNFFLAVLNAQAPGQGESCLCICVKSIRDQKALGRCNLLNVFSVPRVWINGSNSIYLAHWRDPSKYDSDTSLSLSVNTVSTSLYGVMVVNRECASFRSDERVANPVLPLYSVPSGPNVASNLRQGESLWRACAAVELFDTSNTIPFDVTFDIRISQSKDHPWDMTMRMNRRNRGQLPEKEYLSLKTPIPHTDEISVDYWHRKTLVRPVLVSFPQS